MLLCCCLCLSALCCICDLCLCCCCCCVMLLLLLLCDAGLRAARRRPFCRWLLRAPCRRLPPPLPAVHPPYSPSIVPMHSPHARSPAADYCCAHLVAAYRLHYPACAPPFPLQLSPPPFPFPSKVSVVIISEDTCSTLSVMMLLLCDAAAVV